MNFGAMAPGLSAVPGGMMAGTSQMQQIDMQQLQLKDAQAKQVGMQAYFRALQSMGITPPGQQNGPQPPMPGQPSPSAQPQGMPPGGPQGAPPQAMPGPQMMQQPPQGIPPGAMGPQGPVQPNRQGVYPANAVMTGGPPGGPQGPQGAPPMPQQGMPPQQQPAGPQGPQGAPQAQQPLTWQQIAQAIKQQNPGVDDLALAHAVDKFVPLMTQQSQADWRQQRMELQYEISRMRDETMRRNADVRATTADAAETGRTRRSDQTDDRVRDRMDQQDEQFKARENRLERGLQLRSDTTWTRLQQAKEAAQARIAQGDKRQAVSEYRAALDAQHKLAIEKIQASSINNQMKPAEREKFIKDQNDWYTGEITKLRNLATQRGNVSDEMPADKSTVIPTAPSVAPAQAAPAAPPPPKPGEVRDGYRFKGGNPGEATSWEKVE